ncbi:MAG: alpha/beta hydrolase fold domain-containing protein [Rhodoglobus sp.]
MRVPTRALAAAAVLAVVLSGCGPTGSESETVEPAALTVYPELTTYPEIPVIEDLPYGTEDGEPLLLDVCLPDGPVETSTPRPAIVSIHGGSWMRGDKANAAWRSVCQWFASEGFVTVSINYRLAPAATFPAQLNDAQAAVKWLRDPAQTERYNLDPDLIGAFGGSAGGNLAALLGTTGEGDWTTGARVAAVAALSAPTDVRERIPTTDTYNQDFGMVQLTYLGCTDLSTCPAASAASPVTLVDETDPPFFVAHAEDDFIPISQSDALVTALRKAAIATTYVTVKGSMHSIGLLDDDMMARIIEFFSTTLASPPVPYANAQ